MQDRAKGLGIADLTALAAGFHMCGQGSWGFESSEAFQAAVVGALVEAGCQVALQFGYAGVAHTGNMSAYCCAGRRVCGVEKTYVQFLNGQWYRPSMALGSNFSWSQSVPIGLSNGAILGRRLELGWLQPPTTGVGLALGKRDFAVD